MNMIGKTLFIASIVFLLCILGVENSGHPYRSPRRTLGGNNGQLRPLDMSNERSKCERITVNMCGDIGYNMTDISLSFIGKFSQRDAEEELKKFTPLINMGCSSILRMFLCSIYIPICIPGYGKFVPPCSKDPNDVCYRFICEHARQGCGPTLKMYGHKWPEALPCERFPVYRSKHGQEQVCMHFNLTKDRLKAMNSAKPTIKQPKPSPTPVTTLPDTTTTSPETTSLVIPSVDRALVNVCRCECTSPMVLIRNNDPLYNKIKTGKVWNCAMPCHSPYFSKRKRKLAEDWITVWSLVCFLCTLVAACTFLIERIKYPERPIVFMAICCMFVSIGFLIRIVSGHERTACTQDESRIIYRSVGHAICCLVFILIYFFSMAASLWWVVLAFAWSLTAGLRWGKEAISKYSQYYHVVAWIIPAIQTIAVLAMSEVDGDPLSGICMVGNQDEAALRAFVIAPMAIYLTLGGIFLGAGIVSLIRIKSDLKRVEEKTDKKDKLIIRIGIFSIVYMLPSIGLLVCYFYEYINKEEWNDFATCREKRSAYDPQANGKIENDTEYKKLTKCAKTPPIFLVFMVRYMLMLLLGVTHIIWIFSNKTVRAWKKFYILNASWCTGAYNKTTHRNQGAIFVKSTKTASNYHNENPDLMNSVLHAENKRNSRSDTCLLTDYGHLANENSQSHSTPNVVITPTVSPVPSYRQGEDVHYCSKHNIYYYSSSSLSPSNDENLQLLPDHNKNISHCLHSYHCQRNLSIGRSEPGIPFTESPPLLPNKQWKYYHSNPGRIYAKGGCRNSRSRGTQRNVCGNYLKERAMCHSNKHRRCHNCETKMGELPKRLANSLPRNMSRKSSVDGTSNTDQLKRKLP